MIYDTSKPNELKELEARKEYLVSRGAVVELKEVRGSNVPENEDDRQFKYAHVCINLYAIEFGYRPDVAKVYLKRRFGVIIEIDGEKYLESTKFYDSKQMTQFIDGIRNLAAENNCYIPSPDDYWSDKKLRIAIDAHIKNHQEYL